jgi:hypothetical protein
MEELLAHHFPSRSVMCFAMMIRAERDDVLNSVGPSFAKRHYVMGFKEHRSVCHREPGLPTPFTAAGRSQENRFSHPGIAAKDLAHDTPPLTRRLVKGADSKLIDEATW